MSEKVTLSVTEFKARCLELLEVVHRTHETLIITKRGKPIAQVGPTGPEIVKAKRKLGELDGKVVLHDIMSPIDVEWEAMK